MEPTKEQIQWFWEQCGFYYETGNPSVSIPATNPYWIYRGGSIHSTLPPIDLNNLFKYAVPRVPSGWELQICYPYTRDTNYRVVLEKVDSVEWSWGDRYSLTHIELGEDLALALFWVIYKTLEVKDELET